MKKALIGLLVLAAGTASYFLLRNNKTNSIDHAQQEGIIGKWKLDTIQLPVDGKDNFMPGIMTLIDTNLTKYEYEFKKNGQIDLTLHDSLTPDSNRYEWNKQGQLIWKNFPDDPKGEVFTVSIKDQDSLVLQSLDSTSLLFIKQ